MEVISVLLRYDQIHTNINFVHVPTVPLEDRPGMQRLPPLRELERLFNILPRYRVQTLAQFDNICTKKQMDAFNNGERYHPSKKSH